MTFSYRYCDHILSPELDQLAVQLLDDLVRFQDRQHSKDPIKAKTKRRYVVGMREIKKFLAIKKIDVLLLAPGNQLAWLEGRQKVCVTQML